MSASRRALSIVGRISVDIAPLRESRPYRALWIGQLVSMVGRQITVVAVPYQVYQLTHSSFAVGALGFVQVVPLVAVSLAGGAVADRVDRRRLLLLTQVLLGGCSSLLAAGALLGTPPLGFVYAVTGAAAAVSAIDSPTRAAMIPNLVSRRQLPAAQMLNIALFQTSLIAGPALAGLVLSHAGLGAAYLIDVATFAAAVIALLMVPPQPPRGERREAPLAAIGRGLAFIARQPAVLGGFLIDLVAMIFGMRRALFPVLAATTFHAGAGGLGLLFAAPAVGAVAAALSSGWLSRRSRLGTVIVVSVAVWGASVAGFGLVSSLWPALALLAVGGAADTYSAVCRSTMLQTITPDELRGRLSSVYFMVVVGGPYLGDIEAGSVGSAVSPEASIVSGGAIVLLGTVAVAAGFPALLRYRQHPTTTEHRDTESR